MEDKKTKFKFTPKKVYEMEQDTGKPLAEILSDASLKNIAMMVQYGVGLNSREGALDWMEKWLNDNKKDVYTLFLEILKAFRTAGFLPRTVDLETAEKNLQNPQELQKITNNTKK